MMNRREFLLNIPPTLAALGRAVHPTRGISAIRNVPLSYEIDAEHRTGTIPENMMGLSYESAQLCSPDFFSPANRVLVNLFRTLSSKGVLRLGGHTDEFTYFKRDASTRPPPWSPKPTQPGKLVPITPEALQQLRRFLDSAGWTCIYGLNLGVATAEQVVQEALAVSQILGPKLEYLQIGNEPNNYIRNNLRPATWNEQAYVEQWSAFAREILMRVPDAKFGGPDMGAAQPWMQAFAKLTMGELGPHIVEITDHFYAEGPPTSPDATIHNMLFDTTIDSEIAVMVEEGRMARRPYRMTEANSCYSHGKPGVSDTLGSALWGGDLTLKLLSAGFSGINFHGGNAQELRKALGGHTPDDTLIGGKFLDFDYTPIDGTPTEGYTARPIFYGMLLASQMAGSDLIAGSFSSPQKNLTAYSFIANAGELVQVALFNKDEHSNEVLLHCNRSFSTASAMRLGAPSVESTSGVSLGGAFVSAGGHWEPRSGERLRRTQENGFKLFIPPTSAVLVQMNR
jgi:hypothetical protein